MYRVPLKNLPGFSSMNQYPFEHLFFQNETAVALFENFKVRLSESMKKKQFLPIMRMCDGEYIFCVGKKRGKHESRLKFFLKTLIPRKQVTSWGESYTEGEKKILSNRFPELLRQISNDGLIANHFLYSHTGFCEEYIEPMLKWYEGKGIALTSKNYTSFYFIYVLLNGPECKWLYQNKHILVLSSFKEEKRNAVEKSLLEKGAKNVDFLSISPTKSMIDIINVEMYVGKIDIVLIAAGIGSANILMQCKPLNAICFDAGFCLECLADDNVRTERVFCLPDEKI